MGLKTNLVKTETAHDQPLPMETLLGCAESLRAEMDWLILFIEARVRAHFHPDGSKEDRGQPPLPAASRKPCRYADVILKHGMGLPERLLVALALAPSVCPALLDVFRLKDKDTGREFTEFGGIKGVNHAGFLPTGETALFLLAGNDFEARFKLMHLFEPDHFLYRENILRHHRAAEHEPPWSAALSVAPALLRYLITGEEQKPDYSIHFPAKRITTSLGWEDLILEESVMEAVQEIRAWATHGATLLQDWGLAGRLAPGFRALFHGPPGTGKTLTASLLGRQHGLDVYRIDLSQVVSKYIGETEKNLSSVFDQAATKNWILFFDEADALFGKRTQTSSSHDRYANQEVSYLLQRLEDYPGIVILATNFKTNLDDAFARRLQASIYFPPPDAPHRLRLWENTFPKGVTFEKGLDLRQIARDHKLTGGQIVNVVRHSSLMAVERGGKVILIGDLLRGIRRELDKEGRNG